MLFSFDNWFAREFPELCRPVEPQGVSDPELLVLNEALAADLGGNAELLRSDAGVAVLAGNVVPQGAQPVAQAYAGHQFGGLSPVLGDGRAMLLGEVVDPTGLRRDLQLKGSGRTPFARRGDGRAALGPMLREYLMGEAMWALGVPTTRMLAVVATGDAVMRQVPLRGAVLSRVAASHLRIGTFQFAALHGDVDLVRRLADHAIDRHHPEVRNNHNPYLGLLVAVTEAQAALVARWMTIGFIHGVLNTDNVTISGETIDYGPCAFMDTFDPATVFSSIDDGGRYAYGNQPSITQWNLARFAETLLPLVDDNTDAAVAAATDVLNGFSDRYDHHWQQLMAMKLGLGGPGGSGRHADPGAVDVIVEVPTLLRSGSVDATMFFRALADTLRGDDAGLVRLVGDDEGFGHWRGRWQALVGSGRQAPVDVADAMDAHNPCYIARNHLVEHALEQAGEGDMQPFHKLLDVLADPFTRREGLDEFALPAPATFGHYRTFCGT